MRTVPFTGKDTKYFIIVGFVVIIILLIVFRTQLQALVTGKPVVAPATPAKPGATTITAPNTAATTAATSVVISPAAPGLNMDLMLANGSSGPEVQQLQTWLGITPVDGQFGPNTQDILNQATGQNSITLNQFVTLMQSYVTASNNTPDASSSTGVLGNIGNWVYTNLIRLE